MRNFILYIALLSAFSMSLFAQQTVEGDSALLFRDEVDGKFDVSNFLQTKAGFLPVPIVLTNPAIGYGGMLAATFFHESMEESQGYPTVTGIVGGGSSNNSWMVGAFHMRLLFENKVRYLGFVGYGDYNMRYFGLGYTDYFKNNEHSLYYNSWITMQNIQGRIASSDFFAGFQYLFMNNDVRFRPVPTFLEGLFSQESTVSQLSLLLSYDSRDNFFTTTRGIKAEVSYNYSADWLGASKDYTSLYSYAYGHVPLPIADGLIGGLRVEYDMAFDGIPFYLQPFVTNRGVAFARYQDKYMFEVESEIVYAVAPRWDLVWFLGVGDAFGTGENTFFKEDIAVNGGAGFRYLLARKLGLKMGTDISYNESLSFQIVMGSAWARN